MSRKSSAPKRTFYPDAKYGSLILSKFINFIMYDGKKTAAEKIISTAFKQIKDKTKEDPIKIFNDAINNIRPHLEVRSRRVGGATYQVPVEVREDRGAALAMRWIIDAARARGGSPMVSKLAAELTDAARGQGAAVRRREELHRMADANKAFAHYRW